MEHMCRPGAAQLFLRVCSITQVTHTVCIIEWPTRGEDMHAFRLWPGADILSRYIASGPIQPDTRVLELGAGCGTVGLMAAAAGAKSVILTDIGAAMPSLKINVEANEACQHIMEGVVTSQVLDWGSCGGLQRGQFDMILLSDCLYMPHLFDSLARTLMLLADHNTEVLLSHHWRTAKREEMAAEFLAKVSDVFTVEEIQRSDGIAHEKDTVSVLLTRLQLKNNDLCKEIVDDAFMEATATLAEAEPEQNLDWNAISDIWDV